MSARARLKPFYSPLAAAKAWWRTRKGEEPPAVRILEGPEPGVLASRRLAIQLADDAEAFLRTSYHQVLIEFLEMKAAKLYDDFKAGNFEKETYFKAAELIEEVAEHPFKLIKSGQAAADQIREWDQQGLTEQVAAADASRAQGETHAGPV